MAQPQQPPAPAHPTGSVPAGQPTGRLTGTGSTIGLPAAVTATSAQPGAPVGYPAAPPPGPDGPAGPGPARSPRRRDALVLAGCAVLGTVIGVTASQLTAPAPVAKASAAPSPSATPTVVSTVTSFDPVAGGSGFRKEGSVWRSQRYNSAKFGGLKPGIGLVLDLGSDTTLSQVTFTAVNSPLTVELRAGDSAPGSLDSFQRVGQPVTATGATTLPASSGGRHRYWMVWVTGLAPADGGFSARLSEPVAKG